MLWLKLIRVKGAHVGNKTELYDEVSPLNHENSSDICLVNLDYVCRQMGFNDFLIDQINNPHLQKHWSMAYIPTNTLD